MKILNPFLILLINIHTFSCNPVKIPTNTTTDPLPSCYKIDIAYNLGHSIATKTTNGPIACQTWCQAVYHCTHFAFSYSSSLCYLRQGDKEVKMQGYVSGPKYCDGSEGQKNNTQPICVDNLCIKGGRFGHEGNILVDSKPVCDDNWGLEDAAVVCRQLGFPGVEAATVESQFGSIGADYAMENVGCLGNETKLSECPHKKQDTCFSHEAAGVICATQSAGVPKDCLKKGKICLVGGNSAASGNVYVGGQPLCHNGWDYADANVVCRSLGYIGASDFTIKSFFGLTDTYFQLTDVDCRGDEASLQECPKSYNVRSCNTHSVAGVHCIPLMAKHVTKTHHEMAIIGLTIALAITVSILFLVLLYMHRDRFISLKVKVESLELPSKTNIIRLKTRHSVEDLVGADFNQIYNRQNSAPESETENR